MAKYCQELAFYIGVPLQNQTSKNDNYWSFWWKLRLFQLQSYLGDSTSLFAPEVSCWNAILAVFIMW